MVVAERKAWSLPVRLPTGFPKLSFSRFVCEHASTCPFDLLTTDTKKRKPLGTPTLFLSWNKRRPATIAKSNERLRRNVVRAVGVPAKHSSLSFLNAPFVTIQRTMPSADMGCRLGLCVSQRQDVTVEVLARKTQTDTGKLFAR